MTALAHRDSKGMIAVGVGLSSRYVTILEIGDLWPDLRPKRRISDGCYVVAHGRPVYEKNLRRRLRDWADVDPTLGSTPEACRIKAPKEAWQRWRETVRPDFDADQALTGDRHRLVARGS